MCDIKFTGFDVSTHVSFTLRAPWTVSYEPIYGMTVREEFCSKGEMMDHVRSFISDLMKEDVWLRASVCNSKHIRYKQIASFVAFLHYYVRHERLDIFIGY